MMGWLREHYPRTPFTFHDAAIGGTGSDLGLFRLDRDVFAHHPDLVFLDFTVNDNIGSVDPISLASYERILRDLRSSGAAVIPVFMCLHGHIAAPSAPPPPLYQTHEKLAAHYSLMGADTLGTARDAIAAGRTTADALYPIGRDTTHPDDAGYALFFEAARDTWLKAAASTAPSPIPAETVYPDRFPHRERLILVDAPLPQGWTRAKTYRTSMWFDGLSSRWMGDVACASAPSAAPLEITFRGSFVGLFGERNPTTAPFRVWIDGKPVAQPGSKAADPLIWNIDSTRFGSNAANLFAWTVLAKNLKDGEHTLKIAPEFTAADSQLRIESICAAGR
jgi:hypothetical protein